MLSSPSPVYIGKGDAHQDAGCCAQSGPEQIYLKHEHNYYNPFIMLLKREGLPSMATANVVLDGV